jgi:hypothetical protein
VFLGKSGNTISRRDDEISFEIEVVDAMLPGKTSKLQVRCVRTLNRHRWTGREAQGA